MRARGKFTLSALIIALLALLSGCGGGSSGTGVPDGFVAKILSGTIQDEDTNTPVADALVTVLETGDSVATDSNGTFAVMLPDSAPSALNLEVKAEGLNGVFAVPAESGEGSRLDVQIKVNRRQGTISAKGLEVLAKIVGACDFAFANNAVISQGVALKSGTKCPLRVSVRRSSGGLSGIPFRMEHSRCAEGKWKLIGTGLTGNDGIGTLTFTYYDTEEYCDYRIIAPDHFDGVKSNVFPVRTFRRQAYNKANKASVEESAEFVP